MKTIASFLIVAVFSLASCRGTGGGGPTTRPCCVVDHAVDMNGQGIEHVGRKIESKF